MHFFANPEGIRIFKKYGHRAPLMCDATYRLCINYVHIFTVMVIGDHGQGIPVAHFISEKDDDVAVIEGLALPLYDSMLQKLHDQLWMSCNGSSLGWYIGNTLFCYCYLNSCYFGCDV